MASFWYYFLLGIMDTLGIFALMFRLYRFPYLEYYKEIGIMAVVVTLLSYGIRVYFEISPIVDLITQFILYILFFRVLLRVKLLPSLLIAATYFIYGILSTGIFGIYVSAGIFPASAFDDPEGIAVYTNQITTSASALLIAYILYIFNMGFSFIIRPPHNLMLKEKIKRNDYILVLLIFIVGSISFVSFYWISVSQNFLIIALVAVTLALLLYLSHQRDVKR